MKLSRLVQGIDGALIRGNKNTVITGLSSDSRVVAPGDLFIARKGLTNDGATYIASAISSGAKAIVTDTYDPFIGIAQIIHPQPHLIEAKIAATFFGNPAKKLSMIGVTGSKGKTTTTYLIRHLLEKMGEKTGLIGTVEVAIGDVQFPMTCTTLDAIANHKFLSEMVHKKCKSAILEVSSHGLTQGRVDEISWDLSVFTNLYPDHLDYHETMDKYAEAKARLFSQTKGVSILNIDNPWMSAMKPLGKTLLFGVHQDCDLRAHNIQTSADSIAFTLGGIAFEAPLAGEFNVYNILSALAVGVAKGYSLENLRSALSDFPGVPGRLQKVPNKRGVHIFVDYAHTGDSLCEVLKTLRQFAKGRLFVVFGCGGGRDVGRRKGMAEAAEKHADLSIITSDNPRTEDPEKIIRDILSGFCSLQNVTVEPNRRDAIARAISLAKSEDIVLIAGKGHEKIQIFSHQTVTFDDVAIAFECAQER